MALRDSDASENARMAAVSRRRLDMAQAAKAKRQALQRACALTTPNKDVNGMACRSAKPQGQPQNNKSDPVSPTVCEFGCRCRGRWPIGQNLRRDCATAGGGPSAKWDGAKWDGAKWDRAKWDGAKWDGAEWPVCLSKCLSHARLGVFELFEHRRSLRLQRLRCHATHAQRTARHGLWTGHSVRTRAAQ